MPDSPNGLVTISQAAAALGIPGRTMRGAVRRGALPSVRRPGSAPGGHVHLVRIEDVRALYQPTTSPSGGPPQGAPASIEAAIGALVSTAVAREAAPLRGELEAALVVVREVAARLADADRERERYEAAEARLQLEAEHHRQARQAYLAKRAEVSKALARGTLREEARRSVGRRD